MITQKIGIIGSGNMGGAILYGALNSGVIAPEQAYVYDINPAMMEKAKGWGVNLVNSDEEVCECSDIILLAVKPQNAAEALGMCNKALDGKAMMSIVAGVTVERLQNMIDGIPRILRLLPNTPAMVFEAIAQLGSEPEQCLYVGDSDVDILTARNAGIDCLSVTWGFKTAEFLSQFGATRMIDSPSEMLEVIKEG